MVGLCTILHNSLKNYKSLDWLFSFTSPDLFLNVQNIFTNIKMPIQIFFLKKKARMQEIWACTQRFESQLNKLVSQKTVILNSASKRRSESNNIQVDALPHFNVCNLHLHRHTHHQLLIISAWMASVTSKVHRTCLKYRLLGKTTDRLTMWAKKLSPLTFGERYRQRITNLLYKSFIKVSNVFSSVQVPFIWNIMDTVWIIRITFQDLSIFCFWRRTVLGIGEYIFIIIFP